jgi:hypothetical protein
LLIMDHYINNSAIYFKQLYIYGLVPEQRNTTTFSFIYKGNTVLKA